MKLLQKTIRNYLGFSVVLLLVAIPVFYFVLQGIVQHDVDESLISNKEVLKTKIARLPQKSSLDTFSFFDQDVSIVPSVYKQEFDSFKTVMLYDSVSREFIPHRVLTSNLVVNGKSFYLNYRLSMVDNESLIESIATVQALLLLILFIGLFIMNKTLSERIWNPFYTTLQIIKSYRVEDHKQLQLPESGIDEFNALNKALDGLANRTYDTYNNQKEFTENASHELQTPLAILQSKLELLMQTTPLDEEQANLIGDMADASQRMARLNKKLILLTKIANNQYAQKETFSVQDIVTDYTNHFRLQAEQKQIAIDLTLKNDIQITADPALIEILISNLLGNAIRHNIQRGSIYVFFQNNALTIKNTGKSPGLNSDFIFKRFQKGSNDHSGLGLGLDIVKKIADFYNYKITYNYKEDMHQFTVLFSEQDV